MASLTYNFSCSRSLRLIYERWESDPADTEYSQTGAQSAFGTIDGATTDQSFSAIFESAETFGDLEGTLAYADPEVVQTGPRPPSRACSSKMPASAANDADDLRRSFRGRRGKV